MVEKKNFELYEILHFFEINPTVKKLEGRFMWHYTYSFSAYRVPHAAGPPVLRIDIKKEE